MSFEFFIGARYLRAKHKQAFISLITLLSIAGVTVGVMALIIVIAVMAGFEADLKSRIIGVQSHIVLMPYGGKLLEYKQVMDEVKEEAEVEAVTPYVFAQAMLRSSAGVSGAILKGVDPDTVGGVIKALEKKPLGDLLNRNSATSSTNKPGIIIGKELAKTLGVDTGDTIYVVSFRGNITPMGILPSMKPFEVVDTFESGMYEYDNSLAYLHMRDAQKILRLGKAVSGLEIRIKDVYKAGEIAKQIKAKLSQPFFASDWMKRNSNLFSALKLEKTVMFIILTLIVLVAAFNIASTLIMLVMKKTRDIGILKAMGATRRSIRRIFVFKGMVIGSIGTILGVGLGFILCTLLKQYQFIHLNPDVYMISNLPVLLRGTDIALIAFAALLICFLATLYPAHQASKIDPVEAIRYG